MHFARFDVASCSTRSASRVAPVRCTKIAAKLVRTFTDRHGLRELCRELLGVDLQAAADLATGARPSLPPSSSPTPPRTCSTCTRCGQRLETLLEREGRLELAEACFAFLPARAALDLLGYEEPDIFAH